MPDEHPTDPKTALAQASGAQAHTRSASRWFTRYLVLMGCWAFAWIVALEAVFPTGGVRMWASVAGALVLGVLTLWAESHDVFPQGASRRMLIAACLWFGTYLFLLGPVVRWQADNSLGWWTLASAVMAAPFFVAAWCERRRS